MINNYKQLLLEIVMKLMTACALGYFSIEIIHNYMGGRIVTVDVRKEARGLVPFYEKHGFKALKENSDARFLQMIHLLCPQKL